jgi:hypothetical protein
MRKWVYWGIICLALFIYVLGFFDLQPLRFGWYSPYLLLGMIMLFGIYFQQEIDNLKNKIDKRGEKR